MCHHCEEEDVRFGYCRNHWLELTPEARAFVALFNPNPHVPAVLFLAVTRT